MCTAPWLNSHSKIRNNACAFTAPSDARKQLSCIDIEGFLCFNSSRLDGNLQTITSTPCACSEISADPFRGHQAWGMVSYPLSYCGLFSPPLLLSSPGTSKTADPTIWSKPEAVEASRRTSPLPQQRHLSCPSRGQLSCPNSTHLTCLSSRHLCCLSSRNLPCLSLCRPRTLFVFRTCRTFGTCLAPDCLEHLFF